MMTRKVLILSVAIVVTICMAPLMSDDADGFVTERLINDLYVVEASYVVEEKWNLHGWLFVENSPNHQAMRAYIEDPYHADIPEYDDESTRSTWSNGTKLYIYDTSMPYYSYYSNGEYTSPSLERTKVLDGYRMSFFVKGGEEFSLTVEDVETHGDSRDKVDVIAGLDYDSLGSGSTYTQTFGSNTVVTVQSYDDAIATDLTYEVTGYAQPNGSPVLYTIAVFVIAIVILSIIVMCGMHPRWSR